METGVCSEKACAEKQRGLKLSSDYARLLYTEEEDGLRFQHWVYLNGKEWVKRPDFKYEIGVRTECFFSDLAFYTIIR